MGDGTSFDRRLTPARPDIAAAHLRGQIDAAHFVFPDRRIVTSATAPMTARPDATAPLDTELLFGEAVDVYEAGDGWAWGQAVSDDYVGYVPSACLGPEGASPTHRITLPSVVVYPRPDLRSRPISVAHLGAMVTVTGQSGGYAVLATGGHVPLAHLSPIETPEPDWVAVAERFLHVPYLWGGRSGAGLDCSALVQLARQAAGLACPRDSDMQLAAQGEDVAGSALTRGDLVFWKGHVGIMLDATRLLHANAHHMATAVEPLADATARIAGGGGGPVTAHRRWPAAGS